MRCFEYHIMYFVLLFVVLLNCCTVEVRGFGTNTNKHLSQQLQLQFQQRLSGFPELPRFQLKKQLVALVSSFAITTTPFAIPLLSLPTISTADTTRIETVSVSPVRNNGIDSATGTMTRSSTLFSLTKKMFGVEAAVAAEESPSFRSQLRNIQQQQILLQKGQLDVSAVT